jgi:hypothetical protein
VALAAQLSLDDGPGPFTEAMLSDHAKEQLERLKKLVTVNDRTVRMVCEGYSGKVVRQLQVVVRKDIKGQRILSWIE